MAIMINIRKKNDYQNYDALKKTVKYVTRNNGSGRSDLIGYGGSGVILRKGINNTIRSMEQVQTAWNVEKIIGPRLYHYVLDLTPEDTLLFHYDKNKMCQYAYMCSDFFFQKGYQNVFGIHRKPDDSIHIHFIISAVSYIDGLRFSRETYAFSQFEAYFNGLLNQYHGQKTIYNFAGSIA